MAETFYDLAVSLSLMMNNFTFVHKVPPQCCRILSGTTITGIADTLPHSDTESPRSPCSHRDREPFSL